MAHPDGESPLGVGRPLACLPSRSRTDVAEKFGHELEAGPATFRRPSLRCAVEVPNKCTNVDLDCRPIELVHVGAHNVHIFLLFTSLRHSFAVSAPFIVLQEARQIAFVLVHTTQLSLRVRS